MPQSTATEKGMANSGGIEGNYKKIKQRKKRPGGASTFVPKFVNAARVDKYFNWVLVPKSTLEIL